MATKHFFLLFLELNLFSSLDPKDISDSGISFVPGDAFGFVSPNDGRGVRRLIDRLGLRPETLITISPINPSDSGPSTFFACLCHMSMGDNLFSLFINRFATDVPKPLQCL